jgi:hypothetical protein
VRLGSEVSNADHAARRTSKAKGDWTMIIFAGFFLLLMQSRALLDHPTADPRLVPVGRFRAIHKVWVLEDSNIHDIRASLARQTCFVPADDVALGNLLGPPPLVADERLRRLMATFRDATLTVHVKLEVPPNKRNPGIEDTIAAYSAVLKDANGAVLWRGARREQRGKISPLDAELFLLADLGSAACSK